jgi:hypothetical protein
VIILEVRGCTGFDGIHNELEKHVQDSLGLVKKGKNVTANEDTAENFGYALAA